MRCFYHQSVEAVGLCKNCFKALCAGCAVDVGDGLACAGSCETRVREANELFARSVGAFRATAGTHVRNAIAYAALGLALVILALALWWLDSFAVALVPGVLGLVFLGLAPFTYASARSFRPATSGERDERAPG